MLGEKMAKTEHYYPPTSVLTDSTILPSSTLIVGTTTAEWKPVTSTLEERIAEIEKALLSDQYLWEYRYKKLQGMRNDH